MIDVSADKDAVELFKTSAAGAKDPDIKQFAKPAAASGNGDPVEGYCRC